MSMGYKNMPSEPWPDEILEARERVRNACEAAGIAFLEGATPETVAEKIDAGVRVVSSGGPDRRGDGQSWTRSLRQDDACVTAISWP